MNSKYLFYFCEGMGSVFDSQVLTLLNAVNDKKFFSKIYLFLGIRHEDQKNIISSRIIQPAIQIILFKSYPNYSFYNYLNRKSLRRALFNQRINLDEVIFHTRGEMMAWHLSKILNAKYNKQIIPDVRGASVEEIDEFYNINKVLKILKTRNVKESVNNLKGFPKISVVSDSLKKYLVNNYNLDGEKIFIIPCLSGVNFRLRDVGREQIRKELKLSEDDVLIVYSSGGTANWQNDRVVTVLAEKGIKVLNLSKKNIPHKNIINKFAEYSEMPVYLNAADIAIIWRDKSIVNKVASPVKFSEFTCCGLPVISNYSIDLIVEYINKNCCGVLIDSIDDIRMNTLNELKQKDRKKISESGILNFGVDTITSKYIRLYEES